MSMSFAKSSQFSQHLLPQGVPLKIQANYGGTVIQTLNKNLKPNICELIVRKINMPNNLLKKMHYSLMTIERTG